jgi:hypothetical protein
MRLLILLLISFSVLANDLESYKATCKDIGFKAGTENFGACVLKLRNNHPANQSSSSKVISNTNNIEELKSQHQALAQQQFQALQKQNDLLERQYQNQLAMQAQQKKAAEDAKRKRVSVYLMKLGAGMMQGQTMGDSARAAQGLPLIDAPQRPTMQPMQDYRVTLPNGSFYTCRYDANVRRANCF